MSYFIGFLIFIATLAAADPAFAADHVTPIHDAKETLSYLFAVIISLFIFFGAVLAPRMTSLFTNWLPPRNTFRDCVFGIIWGLIFGYIYNVAHGNMSILNLGFILGAILGAIFGIIFRCTFEVTLGIISGIICALLIITIMAFVSIMYDITWGDTTWLAIFCDLLGTKKKEDTLAFIGGIIGGTLATINAVMIYFRSNSQDQNNILVEKGHTEDRFRFATKALESKKPVTLISAFYQFYYLAKHNQVSDFKKNIFDVLCSYLRDINNKNRTNKNRTNNEKDMLKIHDKEGMPMEYYQKLINALFMPDDNLSKDVPIQLWALKTFPRVFLKFNSLLPFAQFDANLKDVNFTKLDLSKAYFANANLSDANLSDANLSNAYLSNANLSNTDCQNAKLKSNQLQNVFSFDGANFRNTGIKLADLPSGKGMPITDE